MSTFFYILIFLTFTNLIGLGWFMKDISKQLDTIEKKLDFLYGSLNNEVKE